MHPQRAFTLIELLIVVAIIAILAAVAVPNFLEAQVRAKVGRVTNDQRAVAMAMETYWIDHNDYPERSDESIFSLYNKGWGGLIRLTTPVAYIAAVPFDPFLREMSGESQFGPLTFEMASTGCTSLKPKGWALSSAGPDMNDDFGPGIPMYPAQTLWVMPYDPTNGTKSRGDVLRFGPRLFNDRLQYGTRMY